MIGPGFDPSRALASLGPGADRPDVRVALLGGGAVMTCGECGHAASLDSFRSTPVSGDLPTGTFQCPKCHCAVRKTYTDAVVYPGGFIDPGDVSMKPVPGVL